MKKWIKLNFCLIPDVPISDSEKITSKEACKLMKFHNAIMLRNSFNFDTDDITNSWYIIKDKFGGFDELSKSTRYKIKRSLKYCDIYLKDSNITDNCIIDNWEIILKKENKIIGFSRNRCSENEVFYEKFRCDKKYLKKYYPYYGLIFIMNNHYLNENNKLFVSDGFRTMRERSGIQEFLIDKFKFRNVYCETELFYRFNFEYLIELIVKFISIIL